MFSVFSAFRIPLRTRIRAVAALACVGLALPALGHSDIELEFHGGKIEVEFGPEGQVFEGNFPTSGLFEQYTDDPGFNSHSPITPGAIIDYNVLGPLLYHDGSGFAPVPSGAQIKISDNPTGGLTVTASTVGPVSGTGVIGQADGSGNLHAHIDFELEPLSQDVAEYGAYGFLMELTTNVPGIANSDPFYLVFNFGLAPAAFETAMGDFAALIPEPGSLALLGLGAVLAGVRRRHSRA